jgi:hypothetical protein
MEKFLGSIKNNFISNRKGQFAIESVLLMTILVAVFLSVMEFTKNKKMLQTLTAKPAAKLSAMIGFGTWQPGGCTAPNKPKQTLGKCHPNSISRSLSSAPN